MGNKSEKFFGKLRSVLRTLPDATSVVLQAAPEALKPKLRELLRSQFKKTIVEAEIKLAFCVIAVCIAVFTPFGERCSLWLSSLLFIGMLLWSIIESISYCMLPIKIMQERSMQIGIIEFVKWKFPKVAIGSKVYELARVYGPRYSAQFRNLPSSNEVLWDFIIYLATNSVTFASIFSIYIILVYWIFKPIILIKFAGLTTMQIYLFPIRQFL